MNRRNKQLKPMKVCIICSDRATGVNFNALTCMSCKAFFRRNALRTKVFQCPFEDNCQINKITRKFCAKCRIRRCFEVGMKKEWILSEEEKAEMKERIARNRETKQAKMLEQLQILKPSQCFSCKTPPPPPPPPTSPPVVTSSTSNSNSNSSSPLPQPPQPPPPQLPFPVTATSSTSATTTPTTTTTATLIRQSVIVGPSTSPPPPPPPLITIATTTTATATATAKEKTLSPAAIGLFHHHPLLTSTAASAVFDVFNNKAQNTSSLVSSPQPKTKEEEENKEAHKLKPVQSKVVIKAEIPEHAVSLKNVLFSECERMLFANKSSSSSSSSTTTTSSSSTSTSNSLAGGIPISLFHHNHAHHHHHHSHHQHLRVDN